jgi:omega-amidase
LPECFNAPYSTDSFGPYGELIPGDSTAMLEVVRVREVWHVLLSVEQRVSGSHCRCGSIRTLHDIKSAAKEHNVWIIGGSIPEKSLEADGTTKLYNTSVVVNSSGE